MFKKLLICAFLLVNANPLFATTFYVATTGNDSRSCSTAQTITTPKLTIVSGASCLSAGDTLLVRAGTYNESILNSQSATEIAGGTSWGNKVRIAAYPSETVWMKPTGGGISAVIWLVTDTSKYIEFDGINLDASAILDLAGLVTGGIDVATQMAHHIRIQNAEIIRASSSPGCTSGGCPETDAVLFGAHEVESTIGSNEAINLNIHGGASAFGYGIYLSGPNNLVDGCSIHDTSSAGVHIYNGGGDSADNNIVRNTRIYNISTVGQDRGWGILVGGDNNKLYNNIIYNLTFPFSSTSAAIYVYSASGTLIANNTVTGNSMPGLLINGGQPGTTLQNNISYLNSGGNYTDGGSGTIHDHNLEGINPLFVGMNNFRLQVGSPGIDTGVVVSAVTTDISGITRPQGTAFDIGAYESTITGTIYYVSTTGNDSRSCATAQTITTPKLTVNSGISCLAAGDTLLVRAGNYNEGISSAPSGVSWSNKVRIAAYPGDTVWLKPTSDATSAGGIGVVIWFDGNYHFVEFDGINLDGTSLSGGTELWVSTNNGNDPHHIRFKNAEIINRTGVSGTAILLGAHVTIGATGSNEILNVKIHGGGAPGFCGFQCNNYGVYIAGPNNLIDGCDIYDTSSTGIQVYNGAGDSPDNNIIRNNRIHDIVRTGDLNQVWGILLTGSNNQIYNNVIYGLNIGNAVVGNAGISVTANSSSLWNNTVYGNSQTGIYIDVNSSSMTLRNNITYNNGGANYANFSSTTIQDHNLIGVNPTFVNATIANFNLLAGSPAIDAGLTIATVATDIVGIFRPQGAAYDIGAYEFIPGAPSGPPSPPTGLHIIP